MPFEILAFQKEHREAAAELLAARHRRDRQREPDLPARYENAAETRSLLETWLGEAATGVAALRNSRLVGFLLSIFDFPYQTRDVLVPSSGHAVEPEDGYETYRQMYAAISPDWLANGYFMHHIVLPAGDQQALEAWFSLGFGQEGAFGIRDTSPVATPGVAHDIEIHEAGQEDIGNIVEMVENMWRYHAEAPIFRPHLPEGRERSRARHEELLANPEAVHFIAYCAQRPVGMQAFGPPNPRAAILTPDHCIDIAAAYTEPDQRGVGVATALLDQGFAWARERGMERCLSLWYTANLLGARFWLGHGFRPVMYRLTRRIDDRIAWAQ